MQIITRNGNELSLINIPNNELELVKANNEEVITDISLSEKDIKKLNNGCKLNSDMSILETEEYKIILDNEYKTLRKAEYPIIEECIHALLDNGETLIALQEKRSKVKKKYPKPKKK